MNPTNQWQDGQAGSEGKGLPRDWTQADCKPVNEPLEGAFSLLMPQGWNNEAHLYRDYGLNRPLVTARTPDGHAVIYIGDATIPNFTQPSGMVDPTGMLGYSNPMNRVSRFVPAEYFFRDYVLYQYGNRPGFRLTGMAPNHRYHHSIEESSRKHNLHFHITTVSISFEYLANGQCWHNLLNGATLAMGTIWLAEVHGIITLGDAQHFHDLAFRMVTSVRFNPQWQQRQQAMHAQQMQQINMFGQTLRTNHQQNMTNLHAQSQAHQVRMQDLHDSFNAHNQQWRENQAWNDQQHQEYMHNQTSHDASHERFINTIREEHTVMDQQGNTFQVDNKHERYYLNKLDNTYIGTDKATELSDLARLQGIDVSHYEEVKIIR